ncbi:MAG: lysylphosphatidylglycerol synthase transmembrane domain-containing protein, partial [Bacteroidota bacterium]
MNIKKLLLNSLKFLIFVGLGGVILYLLYHSQTNSYIAYCAEQNIPSEECSLLQKLWQDFRTAHHFWIFAVVFCYTLSCVSRAMRWQMMLRPLGYVTNFWNAFMALMLGYFANLGFPRIGEVLRPTTLARYETVPFEKAVGTIVVERAIDVLMLASMMGLGLLLEFDVLWGYIRENAEVQLTVSGLFSSRPLIIAGLVFILLLAFAAFFRKQILAHPISTKIWNFVKGIWEGVLSIRALDRPLLFIGHTFLIWFMYFAMTYVGFFAFDPVSHLSPSVGLMVFLFGALGIVIPSPGGMGTYHALVMAALALYGIATIDSFSFANMLFFTIQIGSNVLLG